MPEASGAMLNTISVDLEDYFHPTEIQNELQGSVPATEWQRLPSRIEPATEACLELFERRGVRATFFVLGWVAAEHPALVARIAKAGHEIACHSFWHRLVYDLSPEEFRRDTLDAVEAIEAACGRRPTAYRAPSYSITNRSFWALDVLAGLGFTHDSSIYPIVHDRYGIPGFPRKPQLMKSPAGAVMEVPVATVRLPGGRITPIGGGGYLRLLPYRYTAAGLRRLHREEGQPAMLYFHPWDMDPDQPRMARGRIARLRTYLGLSTMAAKLDRLLGEFSFAPLKEVFPFPAPPKDSATC
jgi:polysaccharide deacetylase family protein (PEP-CTERM system associated)